MDMDAELSEAIKKNDMLAFRRLVQMDPNVLEQKLDDCMSTSLHLATRLRHATMVEEIAKLRPDVVAEQDDEGETPVHIACRKGYSKILQLLMENNPMAASKLNHKNQSAFLLACRRGHVDAVKIMLQQAWLMELEEDEFDSNPLHAALLKKRTGIFLFAFFINSFIVSHIRMSIKGIQCPYSF